jgi:hypothetical protein
VDLGGTHIRGKPVLRRSKHILRLMVHHVAVLDHLERVVALLWWPRLELIGVKLVSIQIHRMLDYLIHYWRLWLGKMVLLKLEGLWVHHGVLIGWSGRASPTHLIVRIIHKL